MSIEQMVTETIEGLAFAEWEAEVDECMYKIYGIGINFLPDWNSRDAFRAGMSPADAAEDWWEYAQECF